MRTKQEKIEDAVFQVVATFVVFGGLLALVKIFLL